MLIKIAYLSILVLFCLVYASSLIDDNKGIAGRIFFPDDMNIVSLQPANSHTHARRSSIIKCTSADGSIIPAISNIVQSNTGNIEDILVFILDYLSRGCTQAQSSAKVVINERSSGHTAIQVFHESMADSNNNSFFGDAYPITEQLFGKSYVTDAPPDAQAKSIAAIIPFLLVRMHGSQLQDILNAIFSDAFPDIYKNAVNFARLIYSTPIVTSLEFASGVDITEVLLSVVAAASIIDGEAVSAAAIVDLVKSFNSQLQ